MITSSVGEIRLLLEALEKAARRQEAEGRARPHMAGPHDRKAEELRRLAVRLQEARL